MSVKGPLLALLLVVGSPVAAQEAPLDASSAISIDQEPHHHLVLRNEYIEVHQILLPPGDSFKLHKHDMDEIAITISGTDSIGVTPGKPPARSTSHAGRVSYAPAPRVHLVHNIGATDLHNVAVTLLHPQANLRNLCATPKAGEPPNCPASAKANPGSPYVAQPQFETDQTRATLIRVQPNGAAPAGPRDRDELIVAVDDVVMASSAKDPGRPMHAGEFLWVARGTPPNVIKNSGDKEARFVTLEFKPL